jgi:hypothetical protein
MNLLFTDGTTGNAEIKELLGFLDVDVPYKNLKSKIISATNDVIDLIGKTTYDLAVTEYQKESAQNDAFIFAVRYPIAIQAYREYAPHNDVSHTNQGRLNRLEKDQKSAFQWQIDNDNEALERSYYKALDDLIKYLDTNIESWKETPEFKQTHHEFISTAKDFDSVYPIGKSRLLFLKMSPAIDLCENLEIIPRVGKELIATIKETPEDYTKLLKTIHNAIVFYALSWSMRRMSVKLFPEGALQGFKSERIHGKAQKSAENNEAYAVAHYFEQDFNKAVLEIENMVSEINRPVNEEVAELTPNINPNNQFLSL